MDTTLSEQLAAQRAKSAAAIPARAQQIMHDATEGIRQAQLAEKALKQGQEMPHFTLPNALGEKRSLAGMLADGPAVVAFYRGGWCPYCNIELRALQRALGGVREARGSLVAITPEPLSQIVETMRKNELEFEVLNDASNRFARELGLVFQLPEALRQVYVGFGIDLVKHNGEPSWELPLAATYVVDKSRVVRYGFVDADYRFRAEPSEVIEALRAIAS